MVEFEDRLATDVEQRILKENKIAKTEGLNAQHMNTQNAARCITLIKKTLFTTH